MHQPLRFRQDCEEEEEENRWVSEASPTPDDFVTLGVASTNEEEGVVKPKKRKRCGCFCIEM